MIEVTDVVELVEDIEIIKDNYRITENLISDIFFYVLEIWC